MARQPGQSARLQSRDWFEGNQKSSQTLSVEDSVLAGDIEAKSAPLGSSQTTRSCKISDIIFCLNSSTAIEVLSDCVLLYCNADQQIHRLNASSAVLAFRLETGATINELAIELSRRGVGSGDGSNWIMTFLAELAQLGLLAAKWPPAGMPVEANQQINIGALSFVLQYSSLELFRWIGSSYSHLAADGPAIHCTYQLSDKGDFVFISKDGAPALVVERSLAAIRLKGMILEQVLGDTHQIAALHAAFLTKGEHALLLLGSPGSGKTTLSLALMEQGFRYGSDDITLVKREGFLTGVPLAPAVKEGAWKLVESFGWDLSEMPSHIRPDGRSVRFAKLSAGALASSCRVGTIVRLRRALDRGTGMDPIPSAEALVELLGESRSPDGRCSVEIMRTLADVVSGANCFDLRYTNASEAVPLICAATYNG